MSPYKPLVGVPGASGNVAVFDDDANASGWPAFISETHAVIVGGGNDPVAIPSGAKRVVIEARFEGAAGIADLLMAMLCLAPPDIGPQFLGTMPLGALIEIVDHCAGGNAPDTVYVGNMAAAGPGNDITYWLRFYA